MSVSSSANSNSNSTDMFLQSNSNVDFARFKRGSVRGTGELQTATVSYRKRSPESALSQSLQVDLVSVIHAANKEYYSALQKELESYDCVLYEWLASRESLEERKENPTTATRRRLKGSSLRSRLSWSDLILRFIQHQTARILALDKQEMCLNYEAENWYHADLDYETFKRLQLTADEAEKSVIIGERNRVAIEALKRAMDEKGHNNNSKIAILYGAGHMQDMERRLREEFDLVPSGVQWITAWSIEKASGWTLNRCLTLTLFLPFFLEGFTVARWSWKIISGFSVDFVSRLPDYVGQYLV